VVSTPLTLISGIFYPITQVPSWMQDLAVISPLYHAVEVVRPLILGQIDWTTVAFHTSVLLSVWFVLSWWAMSRFYKRIYD
jgi:lipooligosaccharide transport system permease protein